MTDSELHALVARLDAATSAAAAVGHGVPTGVRQVEPRPGAHWFLCAFDGPGFICLTDALTPENTRVVVHHVAGAALMVEHAEELVDVAELATLSGVGRRLAGRADAAALAEPLMTLTDAADALIAWRTDPIRAIASVDALDEGVRLHDRARTAYERYVAATDPLVAVQDTLADELREGLQSIDQACAGAGVAQSLAAALGGAIEAIDASARQVVDAHLTALTE